MVSPSAWGLIPWRSASCQASALLKVCIVGSGPAGFYTAERLVKRYGESVSVDILEKLPVPFGLVRFGVAPDHDETKNVINQFARTAQLPRCSFLGNVKVGRDVSVEELRSLYHAVVMAFGSESEKHLGIPGEDAGRVFTARSFVGWYNGHPDFRHLPVDLAGVESVAVCGLGNVAVDCARVLLKGESGMRKTDIADHALEALRRSAVRSVVLVGRRGPLQAAFTAKELREVLGLPGVHVHIDPAHLQVDEADEALLQGNRQVKRKLDILAKAVRSTPPADRVHQRLELRFLSSPVEILPDAAGACAGLKLERNRLVANAEGGTSARGTGEYEEIPAQMVIESIGYRGAAILGLPFDPQLGVVPNHLGKVLRQGVPEWGLYVAGWLKRGPSGIIGTNLVCADETVDTIADDFPAPPSQAMDGRRGLQRLLTSRGVPVVDFPGWQRINEEEVRRGAAAGRPRTKISDVEELLQIAGAA